MWVRLRLFRVALQACTAHYTRTLHIARFRSVSDPKVRCSSTARPRASSNAATCFCTGSVLSIPMAVSMRVSKPAPSRHAGRRRQGGGQRRILVGRPGSRLMLHRVIPLYIDPSRDRDSDNCCAERERVGAKYKKWTAENRPRPTHPRCILVGADTGYRFLQDGSEESLYNPYTF
jgi:hypothetical protein